MPEFAASAPPSPVSGSGSEVSEAELQKQVDAAYWRGVHEQEAKDAVERDELLKQIAELKRHNYGVCGRVEELQQALQHLRQAKARAPSH